ncbi:MAG: transporter [Eubacterium sp.]|jgi:fucose permease|nr:transporter [Eubacterium sp.]
MATFFLIIIYLAFISLGLPDSLLGVAWPVMHFDINAPMEAAGYVSMTITAGTIVSSLASGYVIKKLGTGKITFISCAMTAGALLGFSLSHQIIFLILFSIPLGIGAGSVDSALNNYVALHYEARHMSWLHCFWGVGATLGPVIMSWFISGHNTWRGGYMSISVIQFVLAFLIFVTLPMWKRNEKSAVHNENSALAEAETASPLLDESQQNSALKIKGVKLALITFLFYCGAEATMGLWGSSYLVNIRGIPAATAAQWVSLYYGGITAGRFVTGFFTIKISNKLLIRIGQVTALTGAALILMPFSPYFSLAGFILVGLGCAPIYPCMIHETPVRFGKEHSQKIIGYQMAVAYTGIALLPPLLGFIQARFTLVIMPFFIVAYILSMFISSEKINALMKARNSAPGGYNR